jgi:hypothetical protein
MPRAVFFIAAVIHSCMSWAANDDSTATSCSVVLKECADRSLTKPVDNRDSLKAQLQAQHKRLQTQAEHSSQPFDVVVIEGRREVPAPDPVKAAFEKYLPPPPGGASRYISPDGVATDCMDMAWGRQCGSTLAPGQSYRPPVGSPLLTR